MGNGFVIPTPSVHVWCFFCLLRLYYIIPPSPFSFQTVQNITLLPLKFMASFSLIVTYIWVYAYMFPTCSACLILHGCMFSVRSAPQESWTVPHGPAREEQCTDCCMPIGLWDKILPSPWKRLLLGFIRATSPLKGCLVVCLLSEPEKSIIDSKESYSGKERQLVNSERLEGNINEIGCPQTCSNPPVSAFQVLRWQA